VKKIKVTQREISKNNGLELRTFVLRNRVSINVLTIRTKFNSTWFEKNKNTFNLKMSFYFQEHFQLRWERLNFLCAWIKSFFCVELLREKNWWFGGQTKTKTLVFPRFPRSDASWWPVFVCVCYWPTANLRSPPQPPSWPPHRHLFPCAEKKNRWHSALNSRTQKARNSYAKSNKKNVKK